MQQSAKHEEDCSRYSEGNALPGCQSANAAVVSCTASKGYGVQVIKRFNMNREQAAA
jgi:hypothetical protein